MRSLFLVWLYINSLANLKNTLYMFFSSKNNKCSVLRIEVEQKICVNVEPADVIFKVFDLNISSDKIKGRGE